MLPFTKITKKAAVAALMSVAVLAHAQEAPVNPGPSVLDIAVNVIVPTAIGAGIAVLTKGNGWVGAGIGAGVGVAKSIYDEVSANQKNQQQPQMVQNQGDNQLTNDSNNGLVKTSYNVGSSNQPLQVVSVMSLVDRYGNSPRPVIQNDSNGDVIISGANPREMMYGMGAYLSTKYNFRVDLTTKAVRDINLMSDYTSNTRTVVKFSGNSLQSALQAMTKVDTMCAQGAMMEASTKYIVVANRQTVKDMLASPVLKEATANGGITVDDVSKYLASYQPPVQQSQQAVLYQAPPPQPDPYAPKSFMGIRY